VMTGRHCVRVIGPHGHLVARQRISSTDIFAFS